MGALTYHGPVSLAPHQGLLPPRGRYPRDQEQHAQQCCLQSDWQEHPRQGRHRSGMLKLTDSRPTSWKLSQSPCPEEQKLTKPCQLTRSRANTLRSHWVRTLSPTNPAALSVLERKNADAIRMRRCCLRRAEHHLHHHYLPPVLVHHHHTLYQSQDQSHSTYSCPSLGAGARLYAVTRSTSRQC